MMCLHSSIVLLIIGYVIIWLMGNYNMVVTNAVEGCLIEIREITTYLIDAPKNFQVQFPQKFP